MQKPPSLDISDFLIQKPEKYHEFRRSNYSHAGIPTWAHTLQITRSNIISECLEAYEGFKSKLAQHTEDGEGIIFYSADTGSGKSSFLFTIARDLVDEGFIGLCFYYPDLLALFKETQTNSSLKMQFKRSIQNQDFIVVDDLGAGHVRNSEYAISEFSDMVYYLETGSRHKIPLFVSSRKPLSHFKQLMNDSAANRLISSSLYVELKGKDIRMGG